MVLRNGIVFAAISVTANFYRFMSNICHSLEIYSDVKSCQMMETMVRNRLVLLEVLSFFVKFLKIYIIWHRPCLIGRSNKTDLISLISQI